MGQVAPGGPRLENEIYGLVVAPWMRIWVSIPGASFSFLGVRLKPEGLHRGTPQTPPGAVAAVLQHPLTRRPADRVGLVAAVPVPRPAGGWLRLGSPVRLEVCIRNGIV